MSEIEKEKNMNYLVKLYHKTDGTSLQLWNRQELQQDIDAIIENLHPVCSLIIRNDYFHPVEADWWHNFYGAGKYYRLKKFAIDAFFHCLYT